MSHDMVMPWHMTMSLTCHVGRQHGNNMAWINVMLFNSMATIRPGLHKKQTLTLSLNTFNE